MKPEKPQKGNPHGLAINQHIFPEKSITRFASDSGLVQVFLLGENKVFQAKPDNAIFCAQRAWDQRAEEGYMKEIEDRYQLLADSLIKKSRALSNDEHSVISDFYALWNIRFHHSRNPEQSLKIKGEPTYKFTKDEEEKLERYHIGFIRKDGTIPSRQITGGCMQLNLLEVRKQLKNVRWGILEAKEGEFVVPDNFFSYMIVPLTPTKCFVVNETNELIGGGVICAINRVTLSNCKRYYFGRDLTVCPGLQQSVI